MGDLKPGDMVRYYPGRAWPRRTRIGLFICLMADDKPIYAHVLLDGVIRTCFISSLEALGEIDHG